MIRFETLWYDNSVSFILFPLRPIPMVILKPNDHASFANLIQATKLSHMPSPNEDEDVPAGVQVYNSTELAALNEASLLEAFQNHDFHIVPTQVELSTWPWRNASPEEICHNLHIDLDASRDFQGELHKTPPTVYLKRFRRKSLFVSHRPTSE
jgi:hypothetical protein